MIALEDLKDMNITQVKAHIASQYGNAEYGEVDKEIKKSLRKCKILIAYESVGDYGCDSSAWFLFEKEGKLYEVHGSHCSCYGFEGQWSPEETTKQALMKRIDEGYNHSPFSTGGYDGNKNQNIEAAKKYIINKL